MLSNGKALTTKQISYNLANDNALEERPQVNSHKTLVSQRSHKARWLAYKRALNISDSDYLTVRHLYQFVIYLQRCEIKNPHQYVNSAIKMELQRGHLIDTTMGFGSQELQVLRKDVACLAKRPGESAVPLTRDKFRMLPSKRIQRIAACLAQLGLRMESVRAIKKCDVTYDGISRTYVVRILSDKTFGHGRLDCRIACNCEVEHSGTDLECPVCTGAAAGMFPLVQGDLEMVTSLAGLAYHAYRRTGVLSTFNAPWAEKVPLFLVNRHFGWSDNSATFADYAYDGDVYKGVVYDVHNAIFRAMKANGTYGYGRYKVPPCAQHIMDLRLDKRLIVAKGLRARHFESLQKDSVKAIKKVSRKLAPKPTGIEMMNASAEVRLAAQAADLADIARRRAAPITPGQTTNTMGVEVKSPAPPVIPSAAVGNRPLPGPFSISPFDGDPAVPTAEKAVARYAGSMARNVEYLPALPDANVLKYAQMQARVKRPQPPSHVRRQPMNACIKLGDLALPASVPPPCPPNAA